MSPRYGYYAILQLCNNLELLKIYKLLYKCLKYSFLVAKV